MFSKQFMEWEDYKRKKDFIELFHWQQAVRRENIRKL